ncbi:hypothetical protein [Streptomyces xinghaiensis]|uniref:hypothetical protein n=1 Tax=Streptomyces xinghaiensis TaxID=1038928 RepID=UPI002E127252|nr:hypothetical protein OG463_18815 [Streptomyces xinghaiensis]
MPQPSRFQYNRRLPAVCALLGATLLTACSSNEPSEADSTGRNIANGPSAAPFGTEAEPRAMNTDQLEKTALTQSELDEGRITAKISRRRFLDQDDVDADPAACLPLAYAQSGAVLGNPTAAAQREWTRKAGKADKSAKSENTGPTSVHLTLASYSQDDALKAMNELNTAAEACHKGFTYTADGHDLKVRKVTKTLAPAGADEAMGLEVTVTAADGSRTPMKVIVARKGATLAYFPAVFPESKQGHDFTLPEEFVMAQLGKIG